MRHLIALAVVLGTAATAHAEEPFLPRWPGLMAESKAGARVALRSEGPWLPKGLKDGERLYVWDDRPANPRIKDESWNEKGGIALALFVERAALKTLTLRGALVVPTATAVAADDATHYEPRVGTVVTELGRQGKMVEVRISTGSSDAGLEVHGFVPAFRIDSVYDVEDRAPDRVPYRENAELPAKVEVLAAPGGAVFGTIRQAGGMTAMKLATKGKFTLVRFGERDLVGWVASKHVKRLRPTKADIDGVEGGEEGGVENGVLGGSGAELPAGTLLRSQPLHDAPDGLIVGVVTSALYVDKPVARKGEWARYDVTTRYAGTVAVWAKPPSAKEVAAAAHRIQSMRLDSAAPPPPPPPPSASVPAVVAPSALEPTRTAGTKVIVPDDATKAAIAKDGKAKIVGSWKLCLDTSGVPSKVVRLKSTGYAAYDAKIEQGMRAWRYRPWVVVGKPREVCTAATFIYSAQP